jgi:hypothetical protein
LAKVQVSFQFERGVVPVLWIVMVAPNPPGHWLEIAYPIWEAEPLLLAGGVCPVACADGAEVPSLSTAFTA